MNTVVLYSILVNSSQAYLEIEISIRKKATLEMKYGKPYEVQVLQ